MSQVVCLILEGASSQAVQDAALAWARRTQQKLAFLHVVDVKGLGLTSESLLAVAEQELTWLGQTSLNLAQKRAYAQGVTAAAAIRFGSFFPTVRQFLLDHQTEHLFIGKPRPDMTDYEARLQKLNQLVQALTNSAGVEAHIIANDEGLTD